MEKKNRAILPPAATPASGEFARAKRLSEPVPIGKVEPLVLDFEEFEASFRQTYRPPPGYAGEEPDTERFRYITGLPQLKALLRSAVAFRHDGGEFDPASFAERIVSMDMCTRDKDEPHPYYFISDDVGNLYRLYMDPPRVVSSRRVDLSRRTVIDFGDRTGYLYPMAFQSGDTGR